MGRCTDEFYAYQRYGTSQQYSVAHAMEDLNISTEHLSAHNALHDAVFTAHICQKLDIHKVFYIMIYSKGK